MKSLKNKKKNNCNCLNESDQISLFCHDECKPYSEYLNKINQFYDNALKKVEKISIFDNPEIAAKYSFN